MKRILINIDGTNGQFSNAETQTNKKGEVVDQALTNVAKLHLLAGGRVENSRWRFEEQVCLYYAGVGTRGNKLQSALSSAFGAIEPGIILDEATAGLTEHYETGDAVCIFGFSRGASIARQLAGRLATDGIEGQPVPIAFLGCWDTVVAEGADAPLGEPSCTRIGEDGRIARNVELAWHLVALDERRVAFRPTLMGNEERVHEAWFVGVHSDVGGSYLDSALSDVTLRFMLDRAAEQGMTFLAAGEIDYEGLGGDVVITLGDVEMSQDAVNGLLHDDQYRGRDGEETNAPVTRVRTCHVAVEDAVSELPPLVHHSVLDRMAGNGDYTPKALAAVDRYRVLQADGSVTAGDG